MGTNSNERIRTFSVAFKQEKVKEIETKQITVRQVARFYNVSSTAVYKWIRLYSNLHNKKERVVVEKESESYKTEQLLKKVAELEGILGRKQVEIEYLNKVIDISSDMTKIDLKKKFESRLSNGSSKT
ncbi:transposase [Natronoflexus pectinivorans]|uniref:Transposase-like protein n=1 Tax=Natronoflexus pectinivorans TaxID=682526 RepID=A0A4R2G000_9BACT|nr:transposase [Natronoflexus pectinivorans]TCO00612.1 transposase-like protein [Natronoflexus pectinivorans]